MSVNRQPTNIKLIKFLVLLFAIFCSTSVLSQPQTFKQMHRIYQNSHHRHSHHRQYPYPNIEYDRNYHHHSYDNDLDERHYWYGYRDERDLNNYYRHGHHDYFQGESFPPPHYHAYRHANFMQLDTNQLQVKTISLSSSEGVSHFDHSQHVQPSRSQSILKSSKPVQLTIEKVIQQKQGQKTVFFKLIDPETKQPLTPAMLKTVHTQKLHGLILDASMTDYTHVHPLATKEPGVYQFSWRPQANCHYRLWIDVTPLAHQTQEFIFQDLDTRPATQCKIDRQTSQLGFYQQFKFELSFPQNPVLNVGKATMAQILITRRDGKPIQNHLEPIMGSYAHMVGFNEDFKTIMHIHPMDNKEANPLTFHIEAIKSGYTKLFLQVKMDGQEIIIPFAINVN